MQRLQGKTILITGATSGLGEAMAHLFAEEGADIVAVGRNRERGGRLEEEIAARFPASRAQFFPCDLTDVDAIAALRKAVAKSGFTIDVLVNNAGVFQTYLLEEITTEAYDHVFRVNVGAAIFMTQAFIAEVCRQRGNILNVASIGGLQSHIAGSRQYLYASSKAAFIEFSQLCAKNYAKDIRVNCLCPGPNDTPIYEDKNFSRILPSIPMGRMGQPLDVARAACFLVSDEASYITGAVLTVAGGSPI